MNHPDHRQRSTPTWVKAFLVAIIVIAVALVVSALAGLEHGPGQHGASRAAVLTTHAEI